MRSATFRDIVRKSTTRPLSLTRKDIEALAAEDPWTASAAFSLYQGALGEHRIHAEREARQKRQGGVVRPVSIRSR